MINKGLLAISVLLLLTTACYFGTFQGARTIGKNKINAKAYTMYPYYFSAEDKQKAENNMQDLTGIEAAAFVQYGVSPRFDLGIQTTGYSVGFHGKWWAIMRNDKKHRGLDFAPIIWINYNLLSEQIDPKMSLVTSIPVYKTNCAYIGYEGMYAPNPGAMMDALENLRDFSWNKIIAIRKYQDALFLGFEARMGRSKTAFLPAQATIELSYPLQNKYPMMLLGISFGY
jgi:hypothetical protein